jgi:organic hydroperoxide reductase OsmC/OhrA
VSVHHASVEWNRNGQPFQLDTYSRAHRIEFEPPISLAGNAAKANLPATAPHAPGADPEELFVAALSACHMLWFMSLAAGRKLTVNRYRDDAEAVTLVTLRPMVEFETHPSANVVADLHHKAHEKCFIANSVKTEVVIEPR